MAEQGMLWRVREVGQPVSSSPTLSFPDEERAAEHLAEIIAGGARIAEFSRVTSGLEDAYISLDADRT
ncbi:hypothetical protein AB0N05_09245 [Nocardia sp. NPDC051030]|uniref:hypothetical protein n=1 Tax=Nocardia sp. NPDC051030 TaxID=3155162 RepID=UPI00341A4314